MRLIKYLLIAPFILGSLAVVQKVSADANDGLSYVKDVSGSLDLSHDKSDGLWSHPYGQKGADYMGKLSDFKNKDLKFTQMYIDSGNDLKWLNFVENGKSYWVDSRATSLSKAKLQSLFNYQDYATDLKLVHPTDHDAFFTQPGSGKGSDYIGDSSKHVNEVFKVYGVVVARDHVAWVKTTLNGKTAYVNQKVFGTPDYNKDFAHDKEYQELRPANLTTKIQATSNDSSLTLPYGWPGAQILQPLTDFNGQDVKILGTYDNGVKWLRVQTKDNHTFWVAKSATTDAYSDNFYEYSSVKNHYAIVNSDHKDGGLWSQPNGTTGAQQVGNVNTLAGQRLPVLQVAKSINHRDVWYQVYEKSSNTKVWVYGDLISLKSGDAETVVPANEVTKSGVQITSINSDKSMYQPNSDAKLTMALDNTTKKSFKGQYRVTVSNPQGTSNSGFAYRQVIKSGDVEMKAKSSQTLDAVWHTNPEDYRGYLVTVELYDENSKLVSRNTTGLDVSSDWKMFPRYSALTNFSDSSQSNADNVKKNVETMNKFHINASMYYDAYYRPQNPFPGGKFKSWIGDEINPDLLKQSLDLQHKYGQKGLLYNMINATTGSSKDKDAEMSDTNLFGSKIKKDGTDMVDSRAGIFRTSDRVTTGTGANTFDVKGDQQSNNMLGSYNDRDDISHKVQSYYNPFSKDWQNYIGSQMAKALDKYGFDGWQGDTIGDQENVVSYENRGTNKDQFRVSTGYGVFADAMKNGPMKNKDFGLNAVGGQGQKGLDTSKADFQYAEIWPWDWDDNTVKGNQNSNHTTYASLARMVDNTMQTAKKSLIVPAYLYHDWFRSGKSDLPKQFNENAVLLKDASIFSAGGSSMELTDAGRQLYSEYYPDSRKGNQISMSDALGNPDTGKLRHYYDFATAYENMLRGGNLQKTENNIEIWNGSGVGKGDNLMSRGSDVNKIMTTTKSGGTGTQDDVETINMVNFMGVKNINWQVNNGLDDSQKQVKEQKNLHVKYYPDAGRNVKHVWISSPDSNYQSTNQNLQFETKTDDQGKRYIEFTVPSLQVWDLIYMN